MIPESEEKLLEAWDRTTDRDEWIRLAMKIMPNLTLEEAQSAADEALPQRKRREIGRTRTL